MKFSLKMLKELLWKGEKLKKDQLLILFLTGVLLLVITLPAGKEKEDRKKEILWTLLNVNIVIFLTICAKSPYLGSVVC